MVVGGVYPVEGGIGKSIASPNSWGGSFGGGSVVEGGGNVVEGGSEVIGG